MIPFVGHSLGLDCESPFIAASADEPIAAGMVLAFECFLGGRVGEAAGFEHVVHVGESAIENLTKSAPARP